MNREREVKIFISRQQQTTTIELKGRLSTPENVQGLIIFAHGSGSSATSSRNLKVAQILNEDGVATLLFDLLTHEEQESDDKSQMLMNKVPSLTLNKFNIELLTERLDAATQWVQNNDDIKHLAIAYFGASTGAAAALYAASSFKDIKTVISRGGRTDLVDKNTLSNITCPCLFIVGSNDKKVIDINKNTMNHLINVKDKKLEVIKGASHLFEEKGMIEQVGGRASEWLEGKF
jgi:putative phosphoribosyl transferase